LTSAHGRANFEESEFKIGDIRMNNVEHRRTPGARRAVVGSREGGRDVRVLFRVFFPQAIENPRIGVTKES